MNFYFNEEKKKISKQLHGYRGYVNTYNVETLNTFNPELQLKDAGSTIKNKLIG